MLHDDEPELLAVLPHEPAVTGTALGVAGAHDREPGRAVDVADDPRGKEAAEELVH